MFLTGKTILTCLLTATVFVSINSCAQRPVKSGSSYIKLIEATEQTTLPGRPEVQPTTEYSFVLIWRSKDKPETFYWRGNEGWTNTIVRKANKLKTKSTPRYQLGENWFVAQDISPEKIRKGDTIQLTLLYGGKNTTPSEIPDSVKNRIFFKTKKTGWLFIPINKFIKRPDIVLP